MFDVLDTYSLEQLSAALCGVYSLTLCNGAVRLLCRPLPGRAVCAITRVETVTYIVVDLDKPRAPKTAWEMVKAWYESLVEPSITEDGRVELVPLPRLTDYEGPAPLSLA